MNTQFRHLMLIGALLLFFSSCKNNTQVERAFYYWKSNQYSVTDPELYAIKDLKIQKLYVKFFEVEPDDVFGSVPVSKSQLYMNTLQYNYSEEHKSDTVLMKRLYELEIIPTVFIKNSTFYKSAKGSLDTLADNIVFLVNKYYDEKYFRGDTHAVYKEIQIDCDWTEKTRDNYFYLLTKVKAISKKRLSCTLRLYPYKYSDKMGIPPVDKVTLMCYNLTNPLKEENKNSILNNDELKLYLKGVDKYPLHVDISLPVFYWIQVYQNNQFSGLISPSSPAFFDSLKPVKPLWYEVTEDTEVGNLFLRPGDQLKVEEVNEKTLTETISLLREKVTFDDSTTVTLFHLDDKNLKKYNNETLTRFYTDFNK